MPRFSCSLRAVRFGLAVVLGLAALPAAAQTASFARGETVWADSACAGCHSLGTRRTLFASVSQATARTRLDAAINGTTVGGVPTGMQSFSGMSAVDRDSLVIFIGNFIPVVDVAPAVFISMTSSAVGTPSGATTVTLSNSGRISAVFGANLAKGGAHPGDFTVTGIGNGCASQTVAVGANCQLSVTFTPNASGTRTADVTLSHNGDPGTTVIQLSGTSGGGATTPPASGGGDGGGGGALAPMASGVLALLAVLGLRRTIRSDGSRA
jgi:hypothetical protein